MAVGDAVLVKGYRWRVHIIPGSQQAVLIPVYHQKGAARIVLYQRNQSRGVQRSIFRAITVTEVGGLN